MWKTIKQINKTTEPPIVWPLVGPTIATILIHDDPLCLHNKGCMVWLKTWDHVGPAYTWLMTERPFNLIARQNLFIGFLCPTCMTYFVRYLQAIRNVSLYCDFLTVPSGHNSFKPLKLALYCCGCGSDFKVDHGCLEHQVIHVGLESLCC